MRKFFPTTFLLLCCLLGLVCSGCSETGVSSKTAAELPLWGDVRNGRPVCVKGIHLTAWYAGSNRARAKFEKLLADTELNTAVIDMKEANAEVFAPGVKLDGTISVYLA